ncbi:MAG TPA: alanyl-tRNA editing protein [Vicinamibacteria bacterium]|nr:alanyl-tRNA editing protein [Vicinamibacteria bacterium]
MSAGTDLLHRDDPYLLDFEATVLARREHEGGPAVVLDRTAFYAESGGQPFDTGTLGDARVLAVIKAGGEVLHVLDRYPSADRVRGRVDGERRRDHLQQHHGQHLLSRAFVEVASAGTVSFHLGAEASSIDLDRLVGGEEVRAAEARANAVVWEARPVTVRTLSRAEAAALGLEVPDEAGDRVRVVEAEGFDRQPCGGTHPRRTAEVGVVTVLGHERYKGGTRVQFVCGFRALALARARAEALGRAGALLSSSLDDVPAAVERLKEQLTQAQGRAEDLLERALEGEARRLLARPRGPGDPVVAVFQGWAPADLRALALRLVTLEPCVALLGSASDKAHAVFAQAEGLPHDVPALLQEAMRAVGGRGGGRGNLAQGGSERLEGLAPAIEAAARRVRERAGPA